MKELTTLISSMLAQAKHNTKNEKATCLAIIRSANHLYTYIREHPLGILVEKVAIEKIRPFEWLNIILSTACTICFCSYYIWSTNKTRQWVIVGTEVTSSIALIIFEFLHYEVQKYHLYQLPPKLPKAERRIHRRIFRRTCAWRLSKTQEIIIGQIKKGDPLYTIMKVQRKATREWIVSL